MSNNSGSDAGAPGSLYRRQTGEGRRILALLDRKAGAFPGDAERAAGTEALAYEGGGRPFFADSHADFNISHSGRMAAAAYVREAGRKAPFLRTGCDVQAADARRNRDGIIRRFFHDEERRYVEAAPEAPERNLRFFRLWVLKEAYLKMKGFSVGEIAKTPVFFPGGDPPGFRAAKDAGTAPETALNFYLSEWGGPSGKYTLAVCLAGNGAAAGPPEVIWFSREHLQGSPWLSVPLRK
jgi:hypothetical protein